jgi:hypothetical protein
MNRENAETDSNADYRPPDWLATLLLEVTEEGELSPLEYVTSGEFVIGCEQAAVVSLSVARLRKERQRAGFVPLALNEYIEGLVKVAGASLGTVLSWLGLSTLDCSDEPSAVALARLAKEIGMGARELLLHLRIGFAVQSHVAPVSLLLARRRGSGTVQSNLDECEQVLAEAESSYSSEAIGELRKLESLVNAALRRQAV